MRSRANDPIDVELLVSSFELPDVLRQFRRVLAVLVPERRMIVVPLLERRLGGADVLLLAVISTNNRLVDNVVGEAVAFQGALLRFTAIASPFLAFWASRTVELENVGVVVLDDITDVWHAAVADLGGVTVEDLPQLGYSW